MKLSEVVLQPCRRAGGGLSRAALCPSVRAVGAGSWSPPVYLGQALTKVSFWWDSGGCSSAGPRRGRWAARLPSRCPAPEPLRSQGAWRRQRSLRCRSPQGRHVPEHLMTVPLCSWTCKN